MLNSSSPEVNACEDPKLESMPQDLSCRDAEPHSSVSPCAEEDKNVLIPMKPKNPCRYGNLKIVSGKRTIELIKDRIYKDRIDKEIIEVVAGFDSNLKSASINLIGESSLCAHHKSQDILIISVNSNTTAAHSYSQKKISLKSTELKGYQFNKLWPYKAPRSFYNITGETCGRKTIGSVVAYPDIKWKLAFAFKYDKEEEKFKYEKFEITFKYNDVTKTWTKESKEKKDKEDILFRFLDKIIDFLEKLERLGQLLGLVKRKYYEIVGEDKNEDKTYGWTLDYPSIELNLEWGWEEDENTSLCKYPITFGFELNPLIGITYKKDILKWLIAKWPLVGDVVNYIRKKCKENAEIKIDFEFSGKLCKSAKGSIVLGNEEEKINLERINSPKTTSVGISLTGSADLDICIVKFGAQIKGASEFKVDFGQIGFDEKGAWTKTPVTFSGLVITGIIYRGESGENPGGEISSGAPGKLKEKKKDPKYKKEKILVKVGEDTWFDEKHYIN